MLYSSMCADSVDEALPEVDPTQNYYGQDNYEQIPTFDI